MPKKKDKKSADKQAKEKKTSKTESSMSPENKTSSDSKEKDLYLTQIRHLSEELERYQLKCDQLEREKKDLNSQYCALEWDKKGIVDYLKRSLLEKEDQVDELTEHLESQRQAADKEREALQMHHSQLKQELQDRIEELAAENMTLVEKLASLDEFQKQREQLMSKMDSLEKQLAVQREEHKAEIHSLDMKALLDKRRLEKEMESHMEAMAAKVQHLVEKKVPETTRLALQENTEVKACLSQLSEQTQVLMEENSALRGCKSQLSVDVDILEQMLRETSRQSCIRKKVVEQLTEKCQQLQMELKDCQKQLEQLQTKHTGVLTEMKALRQDWTSLSDQYSENKAMVCQLEEELQGEREQRSRMKSIMQDAAATVRQALMEASAEHDSELHSVVQWKQLVQRLLVVLDKPKHKSTSECDELSELQTSDSAAVRAGTLNSSLSFQFELARYRPGDLGFVPRPTMKHVVSRMGAGNSSTHVPLHRKPLSQKTASCTKPTNSAVGRLISRNPSLKPK